MPRDPQPERDWATLRNREWRPTASAEEPPPGGGSSSSSGATGGQGQGRGSQAGHGRSTAAAQDEWHPALPKVGRGNGRGVSSTPAPEATEANLAPKQRSHWCTDEMVTANKKRDDGKVKPFRELQRWQAVPDKNLSNGFSGPEESLEEWGTMKRDGARKKIDPKWDQFKVNEELFGYVSTFKEDLSQYTTPLNSKTIPNEVKQKAKRIADDLEKNGWGEKRDMDMGACHGYEDIEQADEEDLFSAVPRSAGGYAGQDEWYEDNCADGGVGGALLASLRAGNSVVDAEGSGGGGCDHRSLIAPKVHSWWRHQRLSGLDVPPGCEDALVCPFSQRVFGDVSQLVTHWAAALPRAPDVKAETTTPPAVATEEFRRAAEQLTFNEMLAGKQLESVLPLTGSRDGSVWAQVLTKIEMRGKKSSKPLSSIGELPSTDFVEEAVLMRCWRRDQKVEHREVLEGIAAGLALSILEDKSGLALSPQVQSPAPASNGHK